MHPVRGLGCRLSTERNRSWLADPQHMVRTIAFSPARAPLMIIDSPMAGHLPLVASVSVAHVDVSVLDDVLQGFVGVVGRPAE